MSYQAAPHQTQLQDSPHERDLQAWRISARRVTRAWNAWLAADGHERRVRYRAFVSALDEEERAAVEVEHAAQPEDAIEWARLPSG